MNKVFLNKKETALVTCLSERTIDRMEKAGTFPKKILLGARKVGWYYDDVINWTATRPAAGGGDAACLSDM